MKINIGIPTFIFFVSLLLYTKDTKALLPFCAAIIHECGHIAAMKTSSQTLSEITILPFGIDIKKKSCLSSYKTDIFVSSAGILANIATLLICLGLKKSPALDFFISSNLLLIFVNVLPIKTLDGGQVLLKLLLLKFDISTAEKVVNICSLICIIALGSVAVWLLFYTSYNFTLLLMCIYLFCGIFLK